MTKRIILPSIGSRGDIQPYIALASALQRGGYKVTVATHPCIRELVEFYDVPFVPVGPDIDIGLEAAAMRNRSFHFMIGMIRVMMFSFSVLEKIHVDLLEVCKQANLVVVSHTRQTVWNRINLACQSLSVTLHTRAIPASNHECFIKRTSVGSAAFYGEVN